jgi:hypothetical protein
MNRHIVRPGVAMVVALMAATLMSTPQPAAATAATSAARAEPVVGTVGPPAGQTERPKPLSQPKISAVHPVRYNAIWKPGNDGRTTVHGWTLDALIAKHWEMGAVGYGIDSIQWNWTDNGEVYDAIFKPSSEGAHAFGVNMTYDQLIDQIGQKWVDGRRVSFVRHHYDGWGVARYDAIFQPGTDGRRMVVEWPASDVITEDNRMRGLGYRMVQATGVLNPFTNQVRYDAIWMPGTDARPALFGATWDQLAQANAANWNLGYRMKYISSYLINLNTTLRYDAIWEPGTDGRPIIFGWDLNGLVAKNAELWAAGYRMDVVQPYFTAAS